VQHGAAGGALGFALKHHSNLQYADQGGPSSV
jgi:hypothetical protein